MRFTIVSAASALALALVSFPHGASAANAHNPYGNINHRNDAGNDTGDSRVDTLNAAQLNENYKGPYYYPSGQVVAAPPPAPAYPPPPPAYPPPGYPPQP